jgi:hypothetical protein
MDWKNRALDHLKVAFGKRPFSSKQAVVALKREMDYSDNAVYQVLHGLAKEGSLIKLGRGIYKVREKEKEVKDSITISDKVTVTLTSGSLIKAVNILKEKGIEFMVTGPSALTRFHHHLPRRLIHLIYVIAGAGEFASSVLREEGFRAFFNPKRGEVEMALQTFEDRDIFVIREYTKLEGNVGGRAVLEKAIVDTYFEATRHRVPFSELEVGRIIANAFRAENLDIARLLSLAGRRGIKGELQSVVKELIQNAPMPMGVTNEHVKQVLKGIRE